MGRKDDRPTQWASEAIFDAKHDRWVFKEYRPSGDHKPRIKPLEPWQLNEHGIPLPGLDPNQDGLEEQQDATPRASSSNLVDNLSQSLQNLNLDEPDAESNSRGDPPFTAQSPPNYSYSGQEQGNPYGHNQQGYDELPETIPQPSSKGKEREHEEEASPSSSRNEGNRKSKHSSSHHRRKSHKKSSSSKGSSAHSNSQHQSRSSGSGEDPAFYGLAGAPQHRSHRTHSSHSALTYPLPPVTEDPVTSSDSGVYETQIEGGEYGQSGNYESLLGAGSSTTWPANTEDLPLPIASNPGAAPYTTTVSALQPAVAAGRRGPSNFNPFPRIDPRCVLYRADDYRPGRIFKLMWSEPRGIPRGRNNSILTDAERAGPSEFSSLPWQGYRRFIVVKTDKGHSSSVYQGQACTKYGVKPEQHGIVHDADQPWQMVPGEPKLGFLPVRAEMRYPNEQLTHTSRVNYSKIVTLEMNNPVLWVGTVLEEDWPIVQDACNRCWGRGNLTWGASGAWGGGGKRR